MLRRAPIYQELPPNDKGRHVKLYGVELIIDTQDGESEIITQLHDQLELLRGLFQPNLKVEADGEPQEEKKRKRLEEMEIEPASKRGKYGQTSALVGIRDKPHRESSSDSSSESDDPNNLQEKSVYGAMWQQNYESLKEFHKQNGHCNVPRATEQWKSLGHWVQNQRRKWKTGKLQAHRVKLLQALNFEWDLRYHNYHLSVLNGNIEVFKALQKSLPRMLLEKETSQISTQVLGKVSLPGYVQQHEFLQMVSTMNNHTKPM